MLSRAFPLAAFVGEPARKRSRCSGCALSESAGGLPVLEEL